MKKILWLYAICILLADNSYSQNFNWITPNKTYLKLYLSEDGIYRINQSDFSNAGVNPSTIDPRTVKVLYKGVETPVFFQGEDDGTFDAGDFLDFYGKRNYGGLTPHRNGFNNVIDYVTDEYYNLYSDTSVYWIDWGGSNGLRMEKSTFVSSQPLPDNNFFRKVHFENDNFYYLGETTNPSSDFRYFSNELVVGESWFWKELSTDESLTDTTFINDLSPNAQTCSLYMFIKPVSYTEQVFNEHRVEIRINNTTVDTLVRNNLTRFDTTIIFPANLLNNNAVNSVTFHYIPTGNQFFFPKLHVDFFNLSYQKDFTIRGNHLKINLTGSDTTSKLISLEGYNSSNPTYIFDINNFIKIENFSGSGTGLSFTGKGNSDFEVINQQITKKPFRIVNRQVKDLVSTGNGADYLIIYNALFESQVQQLQNHRQNFDNFRSFKAEMQDIYDIFNYGIEDPVAVRYFVKHAYENWQQPRVKYVCLFGRASLDPKRNSSGSTYFHNFVPTYGNPPSDGYFVNFNIGSFVYYHMISVGRLPVYTVTEAQDVVNKIITYDTQQPDKWWKNFISITGGGTRGEQQNFQAKSEFLVNNYMHPPPSSMNISKIYRNDSAGYITYNYKDSIKKEIDRGSMFINFIGHAAAQDWEIGLEDPNTLNNGTKQPLVLSFTCFTGKNSEPNFRSFGEKFYNLPNKGAIGFVGSTGWSFSGAGDICNEYIVKNFSTDSARRTGDLLSYASASLLSQDSSVFSIRNTINCYSLLGDPASKLLMPNTPEFEIRENDYSLSNPFPALGETIKLSVFPKNLGTYIDTVRIKFQLKKDGIPAVRKDTMISTFSYQDTLGYFFSIDTIGNYTMTVVIDPLHSYAQNFTNNDSITFALTLRNLSYVPLKPLDNVALSSGTFRFTGLNPNTDPNQNSVKVILQVDTTSSFNSPVLQTYNNSNISGIVSSFDVTVPVTEINTLYFLRTNAIINNDSSGWSDVSRVIYNPSITAQKESMTDSAYTIYTLKPQQYNEAEITNLVYTPDGFKLNSIGGSITIRSQGSSGPEASYFIINNGSSNITYYSDGGENRGLNFAKVKRLTGQVVSIENFQMSSPQSSDSVLSFLNTFDSTEYMMGYFASFVANADSLRANAISKLGEFGSRFIDSIRLDFFDTWVFFGYLGADTSQTCEQFHQYSSNNTWTPLICQVNPSFQNTSGKISKSFGTADRWKEFSWDQNLSPNSFILFDIFGVNRDNVPVLLQSNISNSQFVNIDTTNFYTYPSLRLDAKLSIDTALGGESPVFKSLNFKYYPPCEITPDNYSFAGGDTIVQEGDSVRFSVNYYNVGFIDAPAYVNRWYARVNGTDRVVKLDTITDPLKVDSMRNSSVAFSTAGMRDPKTDQDTIELYFESALLGNRNEIFSFNNTAFTRFVVYGDSVKPVMDVTYDGMKIINGDYIQSKPEVVLKFYDDSRMVISDTSNVRVYLDNKYVPYFINGVQNPVISITFPDNRFLQATVNYKPTLSAGVHKFRFVANDITQNLADSIVNSVVVDNTLRIQGIANYPNPMKTETNFMFMLSGELNPTSCKLKIYTVTGRLIKEITTPAVIGYNSIYWDGKDNDGDFIANGTYLYKFIIEGNSQVETSIQKLAVLR